MQQIDDQGLVRSAEITIMGDDTSELCEIAAKIIEIRATAAGAAA